MSYQLYRNTTLGHTLQESLDELMQHQMLSPALALRVLIQFDKSINTALNTRVKTKLNFKVSAASNFPLELRLYNSCCRLTNSTPTVFVTTSGLSY